MRARLDFIFDLVKSLSAQEKRLVIQYSNRHKFQETKYMKLFRWLDRMSDFDEEALRRNAASEGWERYVPIYKSYLANIILEVLSKAKAYDSSDREWMMGRFTLDILKTKGLNEHVRRKFSELENKLEAVHNHYDLQMIVDKHRRFIMQKKQTGWEEEVMDVLDRQERSLQQLNLAFRIQKAHTMLQIRFRNYVCLRKNLNRIRMDYFMHIKEDERMFEACRDNIQIEREIVAKSKKPRHHNLIVNIGNLIGLAMTRHHFDLAEEHLKDLEGVEGLSEREEGAKWSRVLLHRLSLFFVTGDQSGFDKQFEELSAKWEKYQAFIPKDFDFIARLQLASLHWRGGDAERAEDVLKHFLSFDFGTHPSIFRAFLLWMFIYLDEGKDEMAESVLRRLIYHDKQNPGMEADEPIALKAAQKMLYKTKDEKEKIKKQLSADVIETGMMVGAYPLGPDLRIWDDNFILS
jgi:hypothetical protein